MKIGFLIYGSINTLSGGYLYNRKLVEYLRAQGDRVEIISIPWRNYGAHLTDNFSFNLPGNFDVLIQDELNHPSLIAANRGKHPYPIISLVHHLRCSELRPKWQNDLYRVVEKKYLRSVDGFIFNSQTTKGVVNNLINIDGRGDPSMPTKTSLGKMSHHKVTIVTPERVALATLPSIVAYPPTDRFGDAISENEIIERAKTDELRIIFLGNIIERKGLHILLGAVKGDALSLSKSQKSKINVDVIGSLTTYPPYAKRMQEFVTVNGLSSSITFHSSLDNEPLKQKLKQAHILIVPSSYEGFGIVYLEGMAFGLPAIGTTAGAASEIIEHGKTGYLIEPSDSTTLATHISSLASNRELLTQLSLNARKRYIQQPSWNETAGQIRAFLSSFVRS